MKTEKQIVEKWRNTGMMDHISSYSQKYILAHLLESLADYMINTHLKVNEITETIIFPAIVRIFVFNPHTLIFFTPEKFYSFVNSNIKQNIEALKILYPNNNTEQKLTDYIVEKFTKEGYEQL